MSDQFDYVIVGSGAAGSVLASRLSEDASVTLCVLEAGPTDKNPFIHIPAGFMKTMNNPAVNWMYETVPSEGTGGRAIKTPRGKTLGGSTSINGHVYSRGQAADYDDWAALGNVGWRYEEVLPYFKRAERRIGEGDDHYRGRDGGLVVTNTDWEHPLCEAFMQSAISIGIPPNPDYNGKNQDGVSYTQRAIYKRRRVSAYRAFLQPRQHQRNVDVRTQAHVTQVLFEGKKAIGVRYSQGGKTVDVMARKEVILCGGAINTPQLMQLSGVGPGELLQEIGIETLHHLPGVGENLRDHYAVRMTALVKNATTINERSHGFRLALEVLKYYCGQPSILGLPSTVMYAFWKSRPALERGDIQISFMPASYREGVQSTLDHRPGMSIATWQQRPESQGYVRAKSSDPLEKPAIQPNYLAAEIDRRTLFDAMRIAHQILRSPSMSRYWDRDNTPELNIDDDSELWSFAQQRGTTAFHVMGTCKMGLASDPMAVVDNELKVHGMENLRVVDASVMPTMPSCNINAPTIMIGEKAADLIRGKSIS